MELNPGSPIVVQVCTDYRLRVRREVVAALIGVPRSELAVMPPLMGVADVRLLLNCIRFAAETMPAARLLSALQGELQRAQGMINLSGAPLREAIVAAPPGSLLTQAAGARPSPMKPTGA